MLTDGCIEELTSIDMLFDVAVGEEAQPNEEVITT
jgi:hypothetical protein